MARLFLPFSFFVIVAARSVSANCEGEYTADVPKIIQEMAEDKITWGVIKTLKHILIHDGTGASFDDICKECDQLRKLSICIKAVQHKWKLLRPESFTVNPSESDCECRRRKFYSINDKIRKQQMYLCPATTMQILGFDNIMRSITEPPFLIGQGSHSTQYRVRVFKREDPASVEGQLTGFSLNALRFVLDSNGHYKYVPVYEHSGNVEFVCVIVPSRETVNMADDRFERHDSSAGDSDTSDEP